VFLLHFLFMPFASFMIHHGVLSFPFGAAGDAHIAQTSAQDSVQGTGFPTAVHAGRGGDEKTLGYAIWGVDYEEVLRSMRQ